MKYRLITLRLISTNDYYVISSSFFIHTETSNNDLSSTQHCTQTFLKPEKIDYHCYHRILSALANNLYDILLLVQECQISMDALEEEYAIDDTGIEWFTLYSFNKFMMVDSKSINNQIHEFQDYIHNLQYKENHFFYDYKVSCIIDKLSPS